MVAVTALVSLLAFAAPILGMFDKAHLDAHASNKAPSHRRHHAKRALAKRCEAGKEHGDAKGSQPTSSGKPKPTTTHAATSTSTTKAATSKDDLPDDLSKILGADVSGAHTWSTVSSVKGSEKLSDSTLNVYRSSKNYKYTTDIDGLSRNTDVALRAFYQKGSTSPGHSGGKTPGLTIYAKTGTDLTKGKEVVFSYKAYFPKDFDFVHGGKMPGLYGGVNDQVATQCSGGHHPSGCFSLRMMWRENGEGEIYSYLPQLDSNTKAYKKATSKVEMNNNVWGVSVGRGLFSWKRGAWTQITQRVKLNTVGKQDGELEISVDGKSILNIENLVYRTSAAATVRGAQIETFFGGHDYAYWHTPKDQYSYFKDFTSAVLD